MVCAGDVGNGGGGGAGLGLALGFSCLYTFEGLDVASVGSVAHGGGVMGLFVLVLVSC